MAKSLRPVRPRRSGARWGRRAATAAAVVAVPIVAVAAPASAATRFPSTCPSPATAGDWSTNCYVGVSYDNFSVPVFGVKAILNSDGDLTETWDNHFDSTTANDTEIWQFNHSLGVDGIVGTNTWKAMYGNLVSAGSDSQFNYYDVFGSVNNYLAVFQKHNSGTSYWQVSAPWCSGTKNMSYNNGSC